MTASPVQRLLDALDTHGCNPRGSAAKGWTALCPAHDDRTPSLGVAEGDDGRGLIKCYAGCEPETVVAALGLSLADLYSERVADPVVRRETAHYDYVDPAGELLYQVVRFDPKGFRQRRPNGPGWLWDVPASLRVIYRLPQVLAAVAAGVPVVIVEGERDVAALEHVGKVATTSPGGAGKWQASYNETFRGAKVAIVTDNDDPGRKHALAVASALFEVAASVDIFEPVVGKDISDHLAAGFPLRALRKFAGETTPAAVNGHGGSAIWVGTARELSAIPAPNIAGRLLGPLVYRGHRLMVAAATGHGKTTLCLGMLAAITTGSDFLDWSGCGGVKALVVDVEQGRGTIQRRIREAGLAQSDDIIYAIAPDGLALDTDESHASQLEALFEKYEPAVVLADPFYKLHRGDVNDARAAIDLMRRFDAWRDTYGFALLLPMHMRKPMPGTKFTMSEIFGSGAYQWGAETIVGLEMKRVGFSYLHFWKDREGDLELLNERWGLTFDRSHGYHKAPDDDPEQSPALARVRVLVTTRPGISTIEIRHETGFSQIAVKKLLDGIGAEPDEPGGPIRDKHWRMPPSLFDAEAGAA